MTISLNDRAEQLYTDHAPATTDGILATHYRFLALIAEREQAGLDPDEIGPHLLVLRYGAPMAATTKGLRAAGISPGPAKGCFRTSLIAATTTARTYVEGYAINRVPCIHHAWVHDPATGTSYEPTWRDDGTPTAYTGLPLSTPFVFGLAADSGVAGVFTEHRFTTDDDLADIIDPCVDQLRAAAGLPPTGLFPTRT